MLRLALALVIAFALLGSTPEPAEACGVKLNVTAPRIRRPKAAPRARAPIATGPAAEQRRPRKAAGGTERNDSAVGSGGGETATPPPARDESTAAASEPTPSKQPTKQPTDIGDRREDTTASKPDKGSEATEPEPPPAREEKAGKFTRRVFFGNGSADLSSSTKAALRRNAAWLQQHPDKSVTVEGHANTLGNSAANQALSETRAAAVKDYLVEQGVDASRISVEAYGSDRPEFQPGSSGKNRRVVLIAK